jgi:O-antigen/teichoic acid export membrane protein
VTSSRVLAGRAAVYTTANLANSAIPFLLLPLLTRVLSPGDYGLVAVFSTTVTVLGALTGLSVHGAVSVRFADASVDMARYTGTVLCLLGASTTVVILLALSAGEWLGERVGLGSGWLLAATLASAGHFAAQVRLVLWQARGMPVHYGVLQVLQTVLNLGLSILLVLALDLGWEGRAIGISAAAILTGAIGIALLWRCREMVLQPSVAYARDALRFGIPLIPHVIGGVAIANSDRLVVAGIAGLHEAGIYAAGMQLGMLVAVLADAVVKAVSPWLYASLGKGDAAVQHSIVRLSYLYFAGIAMVAALTVLATPWLLHLIGRDFRSSVRCNRQRLRRHVPDGREPDLLRAAQRVAVDDHPVGGRIQHRAHLVAGGAARCRWCRTGFRGLPIPPVRLHLVCRLTLLPDAVGAGPARPPSAQAIRRLTLNNLFHLASCSKANRFSSPAARGHSARHSWRPCSRATPTCSAW